MPQERNPLTPFVRYNWPFNGVQQTIKKEHILPIANSHEEGITAQVIAPIVSGGDCLGAVAGLSKEDGAKMDDSDMSLARLTADILANQFK